MEIAQREVQ